MGKLIITDFFGVIVNEIAPLWFKKHVPDPVEAGRLKEKYFDPVDLGTITFDEAMEQLGQAFGVNPKGIKKDWYDAVELREDVLAYYDALRKEHTLVLLSNAGHPFLQDILDRYGLRKHFDRVFISCYEHMGKPDPRFYRLAMEANPGDYEEIVMIDDNPKNLLPLPSLGIRGILYRDLPTLQRDLFHI